MNRALLAKELRTLLPIVGGIMAIFLVSTIYLVASEPMDTHRLAPEIWLDESHPAIFAMLALFALLIGAGLLMREREDGTLLFLEGLPVSRTRIFWTKALAGFLALATVPITAAFWDVVFGWIAQTSIDGPLPWKFMGVQIVVQLIASALLLALGMLVSFTRAWFALFTGVIFWGYVLLRDRGVAWLELVDPYALIGAVLSGGAVVMPWPAAGAQVGLTATLLLISWGCFLALGDRLQLIAERLTRRGCVAVLFTSLRWLAPVVWISGLFYLTRDEVKDATPEDEKMPVREEVFGREQTKSYEFLFRTAQAGDARAIIQEADAIHDQVRAFLRAAPVPTRIVVDLASPVAAHAAGQTNWTKIRMPLTGGDSLAELRRILGHETAHVFIEQLSDGRLGPHFRQIRCLHEGLATHVELSLFGSDEDRARHRRTVAGAWSRGPVLFDALVEDETLSETRDPNLAYPLGAVLAEALIATHGPEAPAQLLRAFARKVRPVGLSGPALWRDNLQAAGLSVDRVAAAYEAAGAKILAEEKEFVAQLPRLTATVAVVGDKVVVRPKFEGRAPGRVVCLTRTSDVLVPVVMPLRREEDGTFTWPRGPAPGATFRYILGWKSDQLEQPVLEPWAEAPLGAAAPAP